MSQLLERNPGMRLFSFHRSGNPTNNTDMKVGSNSLFIPLGTKENFLIKTSSKQSPCAEVVIDKPPCLLLNFQQRRSSNAQPSSVQVFSSWPSVITLMVRDTVFPPVIPQMCGGWTWRSSDAVFVSSARSPDGKSLEQNDSERSTARLGTHAAINSYGDKETKSTCCKLHSFSLLSSFDDMTHLNYWNEWKCETANRFFFFFIMNKTLKALYEAVSRKKMWWFI